MSGNRNQFAVLVPSADAVLNSNKLKSQTPEEIVAEYLSLPKLPYGKKIRIDKIACLNYDPLTKQHTGLLAYNSFRQKCPEEFPACKNPNVDYTDDDQVSPVIFISGDTKFRVKMLLWFPLCDAFSQILKRQGQLGRKLLPIDVVIDENDQFMVTIMNLGLK